jgi:hypothetical protein
VIEWRWGLAVHLLYLLAAVVVAVIRSRLMPHVIGAMMIVAGACYFVNNLALILSPALSDLLVPWILLPCLLGELSLALWLVVKGVKVEASEARLVVRPSSGPGSPDNVGHVECDARQTL